MREINSTIGADPDSLFLRIKNDIDGAASNGKTLNDLLGMFHRGYPTVKILELLASGNVTTVRAAAWLLSEIGGAACIHRASVWFLLESEDPKVRFSIINFVVVCAGDGDGELIVKLMNCLSDSNAAVRWKALDAIVRLSDLQVRAASEWLVRNQPDYSYMTAIGLLNHKQTVAVERAVERIEAGQNASGIQGKLITLSAIRAKLPLSRIQDLVEKLNDNDLREFLDDFD
ncbi:MAG: hypothetical protein Tsb002_23030 [Wenzhouxiangellaceae bacterium]